MGGVEERVRLLAGWFNHKARESAKSAIKGSSELFKSVVEAFCARDASTFSSILLHAKFLAKTASDSLDELNSRRVYAIWELRAVGLIPSFKRMTKGLNGLRLHLLGMTLALKSGTILLTPRVMSAILKGSFKSIGARSESILELTTKFSNSPAVQTEKQHLLEEAKAELKSFEQNVMVAREETYYKDREEEQSLDELLASPNPHGYTVNENIKQLLRTMVPTYFFLFNLRMFFTEAMNMVDSGKITNKMHEMAISPCFKQNSFKPPSSRLATDVESHLPSPSDHSFGSTCPPSKCVTCNSRQNQAEAGSHVEFWTWLEKHGVKVDQAHLVRAFKISLAMSMAALGGIKFNIEYAFWANITVGFIIQNHQGGTFRMATLRLQGTVLGATYGYLGLLITHRYPYLVLVSLIPWVILLSYLRYSKIFGPAGVIAGLTAAIVMLGDGSGSFQELALIRITENFIGVLVLILVEAFVWPNRAVTLSRKELVSSLIDLRDCVAAVIAAYTGDYCPKHRRMVVQDIKKLEQQLRVKFFKQVVLHSEASLEPDLWNVPFPAEIFANLVHTQGRMLDLLYFMVCSLHAATEDCLTEQIEKLVGPLQTSLAALEDEVLSSLDLLQGILQVKRHHIARLSKKWSWESDEEAYLSGSDGIPQGNLQEMIGHVHPLLVLEYRQRAIDGTPLSMKTTMEGFEVSYEEVVSGFIAAKRANPSGQLLSNSAMLSFSAVTFSLQSLLQETVELEKTVHELLHFENP